MNSKEITAELQNRNNELDEIMPGQWLINLNEQIESQNNTIDENKKFKKLIIFDNDMKEILIKEAKERRMTVAGFIKFCIMQEINIDCER